MALSGDLRMRVVEAVIESGLSRNAAAERFGVSVASAVRWVKRFETTGEISPARTGGDRRSDRIEAHRDYLLGQRLYAELGRDLVTACCSVWEERQCRSLM